MRDDRAPASARPPLGRMSPPSSDVVMSPVRRQRAIARKRGRDVAVELVAQAMRTERADAYDIAEGLGVNDRVGRRVIKGEAPFELGDLIALARSGRGGARLARAVVRSLELAIDEAAAEHFAALRHG